MDCPSCGTFNPTTSSQCSKCKKILQEKQVLIPEKRRTPWRTTFLSALLVAKAVDTLTLALLLAGTTWYNREPGGQRIDAVLNRDVFVVAPREMVAVFVLLVGWVAWYHGAWRDLRAMFPTRQLKHSPRSAALGFVFPLVNIFHIYDVTRSLIVATDPAILPPVVIKRNTSLEADDYREAPPPDEVDDFVPPAMVHGWFAMFLVSLFSSIVGRVVENTWAIVGINLLLVTEHLFRLRMTLGFEARLDELYRRGVFAVTGKIIQVERPAVRPYMLGAAALVGLAPTLKGLFSAASAEKPLALPAQHLTLIVVAMGVVSLLAAWHLKKPRLVVFGVPVLLGVSLASAVAVLVERKLDAVLGAKLAEATFDKYIHELDVSSSSVDDIDEIAKHAHEELESILAAHPEGLAHELICSFKHHHRATRASRALAAGWKGLPTILVEEAAGPFHVANHLSKYETAANSARAWLLTMSPETIREDALCLENHGVDSARIGQYKAQWSKDKSEANTGEMEISLALADAVVARDQALIAHGHVKVVDDSLVFEGASPPDWLAIETRLYRAFQKSIPTNASVLDAVIQSAEPLGTVRRSLRSKFSGLVSDTRKPSAPQGMSWTHYQGPLGSMDALVTSRVSPDKNRRSGVLWAPSYKPEHDAEMASKLAREGFVVMLPMVRGVEGQPGHDEVSSGEIDDLLAALKTLQTRRDVDSASVLVVGDYIGGTRAVLVGECTSDLRGVIARNALLDTDWMRLRAPSLDEEERLVRSPMRFIATLRTRTFLLNELMYLNTATVARAIAQSRKTPLYSIGCPADVCADDKLVALIQEKLAEPSSVLSIATTKDILAE